ncbi:MAG: hypothetical protein IKG39_08735, partial [Lachnospiraceae bacterium]|nr:hypothetical protein [Lachnospiraceae bacterium]
EPDIFGLKFARFFSPDVRIPLRIAFPFIGGPGRAVKLLPIIPQAETPIRPALELGPFLAGHGITTLSMLRFCREITMKLQAGYSGNRRTRAIDGNSKT